MNAKFRIVAAHTAGNGGSPYKLVDSRGSEVEKVNTFLDSLAIRGLSVKSIASYAYDLLNFWSWATDTGVSLESLDKKTILEYILHQRQNNPAATTINHRTTVVERFYQYNFDRRIPVRVGDGNEPQTRGRYRTGWLHPFGVRCSSRVKESRKIIVPLTREQVTKYFCSLKTWRDTTITGFMLLCGLRRKEVLSLRITDVNINEGRVLVHGKGNKERIVPLPKDLLTALDKYLNFEKPESDSEYLIVVLKGRHRGRPLSEWGVREVFRYHRKISGIREANPHRFRHTFGADMARAGMAVATLMKIMGHTNIQTTMRYVNLSARDIQDEFHRAVTKLNNGALFDATSF